MPTLQELQLFPVFQTRDDFKAKTGQEPPPFNAEKPVKSWYDPSAASNPRRKIVYPNVLALSDDGRPLVDEKGHPYLEPLLIDRDDAAAVNIPVKVFDGSSPEQPTVGREVPVPLRELTADEELEIGWGGLVRVKNKSVDDTNWFTSEDRRLLQAVALKLGVK